MGLKKKHRNKAYKNFAMEDNNNKNYVLTLLRKTTSFTESFKNKWDA